jgi:hypothetical protein
MLLVPWFPCTQAHSHICLLLCGWTLLPSDTCSEFGPVFSWKLGNDTVTEVVDFDSVKALMAQDGKVGARRPWQLQLQVQGTAFRMGCTLLPHWVRIHQQDWVLHMSVFPCV